MTIGVWFSISRCEFFVMAFVLQIPRSIYDAMLAHAQADSPNECVGILAGTTDGVVTERYPLINALASPRRFESEPRSLFEAEKRRRAAGVEFLAVYHSHPSSPAVPSKIDLENSYSDEVMCLIISLLDSAPAVHAFWLTPTEYRAAEFAIIADK
jgi:proteasome lid subunit RPN8/RPN11